MTRLLITLALLACASCTSGPRQLNPGAMVPIYAVDRADLAERFPHLVNPAGVTQRDASGDVVAVWFSPRWIDARTVCLSWHELSHVTERRDPDGWKRLGAFESAGFQVRLHAEKQP